VATPGHGADTDPVVSSGRGKAGDKRPMSVKVHWIVVFLDAVLTRSIVRNIVHKIPAANVIDKAVAVVVKAIEDFPGVVPNISGKVRVIPIDAGIDNGNDDR